MHEATSRICGVWGRVDLRSLTPASKEAVYEN